MNIRKSLIIVGMLIAGAAAAQSASSLYRIVENPNMSAEQAWRVCEPRARMAQNQSSQPANTNNGYCPPGSPCAVQNSFNGFAASLNARQMYKDMLASCLAEQGWAVGR